MEGDKYLFAFKLFRYSALSYFKVIKNCRKWFSWHRNGISRSRWFSSSFEARKMHPRDFCHHRTWWNANKFQQRKSNFLANITLLFIVSVKRKLTRYWCRKPWEPRQNIQSCMFDLWSQSVQSWDWGPQVTKSGVRQITAARGASSLNSNSLPTFNFNI